MPVFKTLEGFGFAGLPVGAAGYTYRFQRGPVAAVTLWCETQDLAVSINQIIEGSVNNGKPPEENMWGGYDITPVTVAELQQRGNCIFLPAGNQITLKCSEGETGEKGIYTIALVSPSGACVVHGGAIELK